MANGRTYDHLVTLLLRLFFGVVFLPAGLGKFKDLPAFYQSIEKQFGNTFLAGPLLVGFSHVLPVVEVLLGVLLVLGLLTRPAFVLAALTLLALFFGMWVAKNPTVSAYNAGYFFLALYALGRSEHDRFSVDTLLRRRR